MKSLSSHHGTYVVPASHFITCTYYTLMEIEWALVSRLQLIETSYLVGQLVGLWAWPYHIYEELELVNMWLSLPSMAVPLPNCLLQS